MGRMIAAAVAVVTMVGAAGHASAAVLVLGRSLAAGCSKAAIDGQGTQAALDTCSRSLSEEALSARVEASTLVNRGVVYSRRGDMPRAMADFQAALERYPQLGEAYVNRGFVHIAEGRLQQGLQDTDRGLALGLEAPERAYFNRAVARELMDDAKGAYFDYRKAAELKPRWSLPQQQLARFTVVSNRR